MHLIINSNDVILGQNRSGKLVTRKYNICRINSRCHVPPSSREYLFIESKIVKIADF